MFSVIFEVYPRPSHWETYLDNAKMLRPELVQVDGFIDSRKGSNALALLCCREALATASALGKR